jgi:hypothetical protein
MHGIDRKIRNILDQSSIESCPQSSPVRVAELEIWVESFSYFRVETIGTYQQISHRYRAILKF